MRQISSAIGIAALLCLTTTAANAGSPAGGFITFDEVPIGTSLTGATIDGVTFTYFSNGSGLPDPLTSDTPGTVPGLRDDITLRGASASEQYVIDLQFPGAVNDFGLSLSTTPFSFLTPISANVRFFNAQNDMVIEFASMSTTTFAGATLPNGSPIFLVGRSDTSLVFNGVTDAVRAEVRIVGGNPSGWYMDNLSYSTIPTPGALSFIGVGAAIAARRRRP